jgi:hypothetical protein
MISSGASFPSCSRRCQTHATISWRFAMSEENLDHCERKCSQELNAQQHYQRTVIRAVVLLNDNAFFTCEPITYRSPLLALSTSCGVVVVVVLSAVWYCLHRAHFCSACLTLIFCKFLLDGIGFLVVAVLSSATPGLLALAWAYGGTTGPSLVAGMERS